MFIEKGPTDCWIWQSNPDDAPNKGALMACRNQKCCNPRHVVDDRPDWQMIGKNAERPDYNPPKKRGRPRKNVNSD